ncbi:hypothetical protein WJT86_12010 [Microvirga sp. W0021]|uniref:Uncharacterized protein n=1 Tax=Hohaiivirga grylli TaxID=3133970 RepID=A0ABV0BLI0_9HYPH
MKVKCIKLLNADGKEVEFSPWLTLGREYPVLSIDISDSGKISYRIVTSERDGFWPDMGLHQADCFEVTSTIIPSNWRVRIYKNKGLSIYPDTWQDNWFLEAFYDRDPKAFPIFQQEYQKILTEDP